MLRVFKFLPLFFLLFALITPEEIEARRRGFSRSRGSRSASRRSSRSSSRSYSRSSSSRRSSWGGSSYRKKGGLFGSSSRSSRNLGSSSRSSRRATSRKSSSSARSSARNSRTSKRRPRSSSRRSNRYVSSRWGSSQPRYRSQNRWWSKRSTWKSRWRNNRKYRYRFRSRYYDSYTPYSSVGIWDLFFLSHASDLFWYHHWHDQSIKRALYQDRVLQDAELARLEAKMKQLETQQILRNPDYLPEGVEPQDMYSESYIESVQRDEEETGVGFILLLSILGGAGFAYFFFVRKY